LPILRFHELIHDMMPLRRYWLSVGRSTRHGRLSASSAEIAAISSMRLLVVWASPPLSSLTWSPDSRIAPQPPGPGLPEQAPSVWMTTLGISAMSVLQPIVAIGLHPPVKSELAEIFIRVLELHQRVLVRVKPVIASR